MNFFFFGKIWILGNIVGKLCIVLCFSLQASLSLSLCGHLLLTAAGLPSAGVQAYFERQNGIFQCFNKKLVGLVLLYENWKKETLQGALLSARLTQLSTNKTMISFYLLSCLYGNQFQKVQIQLFCIPVFGSKNMVSKVNMCCIAAVKPLLVTPALQTGMPGFQSHVSWLQLPGGSSWCNPCVPLWGSSGWFKL